jgi:nucleotidyltransferase substrate binding protein (TIGR01987 family)
MKGTKIELDFKKLGKAIEALSLIIGKPVQEDRVIIDATIQRFEFTIELFWKLLQHILESKGVLVQYPKDVLKEAYRGHLIDQEEIWLSMLKDRNLTSHTYDEKLADEIFARVKKYIHVFQKTYHFLLTQ